MWESVSNSILIRQNEVLNTSAQQVILFNPFSHMGANIFSFTLMKLDISILCYKKIMEARSMNLFTWTNQLFHYQRLIHLSIEASRIDCISDIRKTTKTAEAYSKQSLNRSSRRSFHRSGKRSSCNF